MLAIISDKKIGHSSNGTTLDYYNPDVISATDYYPFGMVSRSVFLSSLGLGYRYSFNGKENDGDVKGDGDQIDYGMRVYDPRLGRFLSVDPKTSKIPDLSSYQYAANSPIWLIDKEGQEPDRNQAGTIEQASIQWSKLPMKNPTIDDIYLYIQKDPNAVRYVYTKDKGWIDMLHYFGTLKYGKTSMDLLEPASGSKIMQETVFGAGANESYYSYEDLPSNQFASEGNHKEYKEVETTGRFGAKVKRNEHLDLQGTQLIEAIKDHIKSAGAVTPESAPNWDKIPFKDHGERQRLPDIKGYRKIWVNSTVAGVGTEAVIPIYYTKEEKIELLKTGKYVPQNHTSNPFNLNNFSPAPSSLKAGDKQKGATGH